MTGPQLTLPLPTFAAEAPDDWERVFTLARAADAAGIDRVVVSDHVVFGEHLDAYSDPSVGGTEGGRQPTGPDGHWLEPLTVLAMVGAQTTRIRLSTGILLAALRRPAVLAKTAATIDTLTGGRLDLGVGVGWQREEYEAAGLPFEGRGQRLDDTLEICQALWTQPVAAVDNGSASFAGIHAMPKPVQPAGVPLWISGTTNPRVLRRIVRFGSGWIPWGASAQDLPASIAEVHRALEEAGRSTAGFTVNGSLPLARAAGGEGHDLAATADATAEQCAVGVTNFSLRLRLPDEHDAIVDVLAPIADAVHAIG